MYMYVCTYIYIYTGEGKAAHRGGQAPAQAGARQSEEKERGGEAGEGAYSPPAHTAPLTPRNAWHTYHPHIMCHQVTLVHILYCCNKIAAVGIIQ